MSAEFNYLFVSDLHLSEGVSQQTGKTHRNEDFFHDDAFAQFINYHVHLSRDPNQASTYQTPWKLVINGDIFDFLQVVSLPDMEDEQLVLNVMNAAGRPISKHQNLTENKSKYGLGTSEPEIVWKLKHISQGHPSFFQALGWFVANGNQIVMMKGNHDVELFWPAVQTCMHYILANAYADWRTNALAGDSWPLTLFDDLPETISSTEVATAVSFPPNYYLEEGLFYAEHGCQYDPSNWFPNFTDPRLPSDKEYLELPFGSLFVRYFFNGIETVHPFADNMKPMSRYAFWLLQNAPSATFQFLFTLVPGYLAAIWQVQKKMRNASNENRQSPENDFERYLFSIQKSIRDWMVSGGRRTTIMMIFAILVRVGSIVLFLNAFRLLVASSFLWMGANFLGGFLVQVFSSYLLDSLDSLFAEPFLLRGAKQICAVLNSHQPDTFSAVPYLIFGHDHASKVEQIHAESGQPAPDYKQWYINTGTWGPIFSEEDRLLRDVEQLTYFMLLTKNLDSNKKPQLLHWPVSGERPLKVRLFE
ncbi:MAG: hypothetical protein AAF490_24980 [Chloroflexota bacterium]